MIDINIKLMVLLLNRSLLQDFALKRLFGNFDIILQLDPCLILHIRHRPLFDGIIVLERVQLQVKFHLFCGFQLYLFVIHVLHLISLRDAVNLLDWNPIRIGHRQGVLKVFIS